MDLQHNPIADYLGGRRRTEPESRKATGRPRKRTPEHFAAVLRGLAQMHDWFLAETGRRASSDVELLTTFRAHVHATGGGGALSSAQEEQFFQKRKTTLNVFGQARRYFAEHPEKAPIFGVEPEWFARCNRAKETTKRHHAPSHRPPASVFHLAGGLNA